jgi:multimeric flavodoxin WrbA
MIKVIAFNGSPRIEGNTTILIRKVFQELEKENIGTELVSFAGKKISGCVGCYKCFEKKNNCCAINDEPQDFVNTCIDKMLGADAIILASPTYVLNITSNMKAFMERVALVGFANKGMLKHKIGASIATARRAGAIHTLQSMNTFFSCFEMFSVGSHFPAMAVGLEKGEVESDAEGLESMKTLGQNIAFLLKKLHVDF